MKNVLVLLRNLFYGKRVWLLTEWLLTVINNIYFNQTLILP